MPYDKEEAGSPSLETADNNDGRVVDDGTDKRPSLFRVRRLR